MIPYALEGKYFCILFYSRNLWCACSFQMMEMRNWLYDRRRTFLIVETEDSFNHSSRNFLMFSGNNNLTTTAWCLGSRQFAWKCKILEQYLLNQNQYPAALQIVRKSGEKSIVSCCFFLLLQQLSVCRVSGILLCGWGCCLCVITGIS